MSTAVVKVDIYETVQIIREQVKMVEDERLRTILFVSIVSDMFDIIIEYPGEKK
jgi:hypothetical protein